MGNRHGNHRRTGKENIRKFLTDVLGGESLPGLHKNQVINHTQHQGIVTVNPDRLSAKGRWRAQVQAGAAPPAGGNAAPEELKGAMMFADGVYENTYVKENGMTRPRVSTSFPPQADSYPIDTALGRKLPPYHYPHPVTGLAVSPIFLY